MNKNKALEVMLTEKCCVERQKYMSMCVGRCDECDLLLPTEEVLQAYDFVIGMLTGKTVERPTGKPCIVTSDDMSNYYICPCCRKPIDEWDRYCKHCGAEMETE